jgi:hypothetical protein
MFDLTAPDNKLFRSPQSTAFAMALDRPAQETQVFFVDLTSGPEAATLKAHSTCPDLPSQATGTQARARRRKSTCTSTKRTNFPEVVLKPPNAFAYADFVLQSNGKVSRQEPDVKPLPTTEAAHRFVKELMSLKDSSPVPLTLLQQAASLGYAHADATSGRAKLPFERALNGRKQQFAWVSSTLRESLNSARTAIHGIDFFVDRDKFITHICNEHHVPQFE